MSVDTIIDKISTELGEDLLKLERKSERRVYIDMAPEALKEASRLMFEDLGARFQIATGVDTREGIEVMYHWALDGMDCVVTLRTCWATRRRNWTPSPGCARPRNGSSARCGNCSAFTSGIIRTCGTCCWTTTGPRGIIPCAVIIPSATAARQSHDQADHRTHRPLPRAAGRA